MKVCIDPGHGGSDSGALGIGIKEKDVTLSVSLQLADMLQKVGAQIKLTRNKDMFVPLSERAKIANAFGADYFVSVHANGFEFPSANGIETFCHPQAAAKAAKLAEEIQAELVKATGLRDRGAKRANYQVLRETVMPAVLVELPFLSNPVEAKLLGDPVFRARCALAIAHGVGKITGLTMKKDKQDLVPTKVFFGDKELRGFIIDGRTYAEVRKLAELLGRKVYWDNKAGTTKVY